MCECAVLYESLDVKFSYKISWFGMWFNVTKSRFLFKTVHLQLSRNFIGNSCPGGSWESCTSRLSYCMVYRKWNDGNVNKQLMHLFSILLLCSINGGFDGTLDCQNLVMKNSICDGITDCPKWRRSAAYISWSRSCIGLYVYSRTSQPAVCVKQLLRVSSC